LSKGGSCGITSGARIGARSVVGSISGMMQFYNVLILGGFLLWMCAAEELLFGHVRWIWK